MQFKFKKCYCALTILSCVFTQEQAQMLICEIKFASMKTHKKFTKGRISSAHILAELFEFSLGFLTWDQQLLKSISYHNIQK